MTNTQIPQDAIEAGAEAYVRFSKGRNDAWELASHVTKHRARTLATGVLNAAASRILAAAFDGVKAEVENLAAQRDAIGDDDYEPDEDDGDCCGDAGECHRSGAMASYARVISLLERKVTELRAQS